MTHDYSKHVLVVQLNRFVVRANLMRQSVPSANIPHQAIPWVLQRTPSRPAGTCTICTNLNCSGAGHLHKIRELTLIMREGRGRGGGGGSIAAGSEFFPSKIVGV